jgi:hypothetical protein
MSDLSPLSGVERKLDFGDVRAVGASKGKADVAKPIQIYGGSVRDV